MVLLFLFQGKVLATDLKIELLELLIVLFWIIKAAFAIQNSRTTPSISNHSIAKIGDLFWPNMPRCYFSNRSVEVYRLLVFGECMEDFGWERNLCP